MAIKTFTSGEVLTASDTNTYLANSGLVYVKSQTIGSAVTSIIVTNAFSSEYNNYFLTVNDVQMSTASDSITLQMRTGTTTANTSYYQVLNYAVWAGTTGVAAVNNGTYWNNIARGLGAGDKQNFSVNIYAPFLANKTSFSSIVIGADLAGPSAGFHDSATSYDQCVITSLFGTMTGGTVRVYGYRKA